nr:immunoglobulin light chain junction region [Macaca mulatta]MOX70486.1 immunoglobulin light chain junction region [Macaca mulatta]MOX71539.1 immunoglobulin light chain junction region [Macaca mulatta]MOX71586.1 immunoglobulin light chain junction region [Macaca mulatta]MOX75800.1 immunoglobulin light chain junction region [Macaca mulatta]
DYYCQSSDTSLSVHGLF